MSVLLNQAFHRYLIAPPYPRITYSGSGSDHTVNNWTCTGSETHDYPFDIHNNVATAGIKAASDYLDFLGILGGPDGEMQGDIDTSATVFSVSRQKSKTYSHIYGTSTDVNFSDYETTVDVDYSFGFGVAAPPTPDPQADPDCDPCKGEGGSTIGYQNQSLGQRIAIAGTPFELHYQSDRMPGRLGSTAPWTARNLALGGWSLSVHHAYDPTGKVLYLGDGGLRSGDAVQPVPTADGGFSIPSQDDDLIFQFDQNGRHVRTLDEYTGTAVYQFAYDSQGRLTGVQDDFGNQTRIERSGDEPTAIVAPYGQRTTLAMDADGYLSQVQQPDRSALQMTCDATGLMSTFVDALGGKHQMTYSPDGRLVRDEDPSGAYQTLTRTGLDKGPVVEATTNSGRTTFYKLIDSGATETLQTQLPDESTTQATLAGSLVTSNIDSTGTTTSMDWTADTRWGTQGSVPNNITVTTPGGLSAATTTERTVDLGNPSDPLSLSGLHETTRVNGRTYQNDYAAATRTITLTSPARRQVARRLDAHDLLEEDTGNMAPLQYTYDSNGRLSGIAAGSGVDQRTGKFAYGTDGQLSRVADALGGVTTLEYDKMGQVLRATLPGGGTTTFAYDANGGTTSITPPGRPAHNFRRTPVGLLSSYTPPPVTGAAQPFTFTWNSDRELTQLVRPDGSMVRWSYDTMGRLFMQDFGSGFLMYTYDGQTGQIIGVSTADGGSLAYTYDGQLPLAETWAGAVGGSVQRTFNPDFRPATIAVSGANPAILSYDDDGYLAAAEDLTIRRDANGLTTGTSLGKVSDSLTYNAFGELSEYRATGPAGALMAVRYTRDKLGRITDESETIGATATAWKYGYDAAGRLASVDRDGAALARYSFDANGNRTKVTAGSTTENALFDDQDRLSHRGTATYTYTASGELGDKNAAGKKTHYDYDPLGNLRNVLLPDGRAISYIIDGANRRVGKTLGGKLAKGWLYLDALRPVAELDAAGKLVSLFVYGDDPGAPAYLVKGGITYRILTDHLGSPRLVIDSSTGQIAQRMDYDAFGKVVADTSPGFHPFGFAGGMYDADTGLVRFGARDYDAEAGRWTAKDPLDFGGGDTNLYAYAANDPVNRVDPTGSTMWRMDNPGIPQPPDAKPAQLPPPPPKPATPPLPPKQANKAAQKVSCPKIPIVMKPGKTNSHRVKIIDLPITR